MNNTLLKTSSSLLLVGALSACGGGSGSGNTPASNITTYDGAWAQTPVCDDESYTDPISSMTISESIKASVIIKGSTADMDISEYPSSNNCTGVNDRYIASLNLVYGADVPTASSICSNAKKVDVSVTSMKINGVQISASALAAAIAADQVPSLDAYGLICTSPDGSRLYFGDDENGTKLGDSESTRPTQIDSTIYLVK